MFIVDFRNRNMSEYRFSVMNNSNVDVVNLYSRFTQYAQNTSIYLKIRSVDDDYVDKIAIASENVSVDADALVVKWTMGAVSTHCKKIYLQLQFEKEGDIVDQTSIVGLTLADTIDVEGLIPPIYPQVLKELQEQIDTLFAKSGAKVTLAYDNDVLTINLLNEKGDVVDTKTKTIPTNKSFKSVTFNNRIITFTANDGTTQQVDLSDIYTKTETNNLLATKVDKVNTSNKVYGTDGSGNQTTYALDNGTGYSGNVARRDTSNQLHVPQTPTADDHAVSKKYADTLVADIKKDSYKEVDTTEYPTLNDFLASTGEEGFLYLYPIDTTDLTKGYYRYVWENNTWLDLGTTQIDLSDYYTKSESDNRYGRKSANETISGEWTFNSSNGVNIGTSKLKQSATDNLIFYFGGVEYYNINVSNFRPTSNNARDLGSSSYKWKDLYVAGNLYGASYSLGVSALLSAVMNVSDSSNENVISWSRTLQFNKSANTTFTFSAQTSGCLHEYKALITNGASSPINLTFTGVTSILTNNEEDVVINGNVITLSAGTTIECSIMDGKMIAVVF